MSKKNTPEAPKSDVRGRTSYNIQYEIDGERYFEERSLDVNNGDFLGPLGIKKVNEDAGPFGGNLFVPVDPESEEGKKVLNSLTRNNKIKSFAENWAFKDDQTFEAAMESGYIDQARGASSFLNEGGVPYVGKNDDNSAENITRDPDITPQEIFSNDLFSNKEDLKYPIDMFIGEPISTLPAGVQASQDYMFIEQYQYQPPQAEVDQSIGNALTNGLERGTNIGERFGSCRLPIPNKLGVSNGVNWGEGRANAVEMSAFGATTSALSKAVTEKDIITLLKDAGKQAADTFGQLKDDLANQDSGSLNSARILNAVIARSALSRIGINVDVDQFITRETGAAINPNLELLFGGPQLRTFSFLFEFAPNDEPEARMVRKIHRWFRQGMLPQRRGANASRSLFLGSPNIFRLCYMNKSRRIKGLNTFKICALTSCQIDFTPDGVYQSYEDASAVSMPVRSTMQVTFNELTPIFANDYDHNLVNQNPDPSLVDLGTNILGGNVFTDDDLGF